MLKTNAISGVNGTGVSIKPAISITELRATIAEHCSANNIMTVVIGGIKSSYQWNDLSTLADNGTTIIKPTAIATGRWLKLADVSDADTLGGHAASDFLLVDDYVGTDLTGYQLLINTEAEKWDIKPIGEPTMIYPPLLGTTLTAWLSGHPKWRLCDGTAGTPDLTDRFIIGGTDSAGVIKTNITGALTATGGTKDAVIVSHGHTIDVGSIDVTINDPSHDHSIGFSELGASIDGGGYGTHDLVSHIDTSTGTATTGITATAEISGVSIGDSGVSGTNQNLPPYIAMAWIVKVL